MTKVSRFLPSFLLLTSLILVIFQIEPPKSWLDAQISHWLLFYLPLLLLAISISELFLKFWLKSIIIGIGFTIIIILFGLKTLNLASALLTIIATYLIARSLKYPDRYHKVTKFSRLTKLKRQ